MTLTLIIAPLVLATISAALAALIDITDKLVNNYGECVVSINEGKKDLNIQGGSPLLFTLAEQKIFVPSACGGKGSCGACKVQVTSDIGPLLPTEAPYLTDEEIADRTRLACQIKVKQDINIQIPDEIFNVKKLHSKVLKIVDLTYDIKEVTLEIPEEITFFSGQYAQFETPKYKWNKKGRESTFRAYSISSPPQQKDKLEFLIRLVPDGIVTTYVHNFLKEGDMINIVGPFGDFYERDTDAAMICVAGGSGMAPFKSIFESKILEGTLDKREIWYFFGARTTKDCYYLDWLFDLDKKHPNFHFVPALSEPVEGEAWNGATGLITEVLDTYLKNEIKAEKKEGYLCGSPGMLDACMVVMSKNDMTEDNIFFDKFA